MKEAITIISIISALSINLFKTSIEQSPKMPFSPSEIVDSLVNKDSKETNEQTESSFSINSNNLEEINETTKKDIDGNSTLKTKPISEMTEPSSNSSDKRVSNSQIKDGFNYLGHHYELGNFSGTGFVPTWTNTVFQWNDFPTHYLVELNSYPGQTIFDLQIGSEVILNGQTYTVYNIVYNQANDQEGLDMVLNSGAAISIQVCVSSSENSSLNLYFLK
ncbi:hypothetical protein ABQD56_07325 [Vagococcus fluvialis]|uniref:hypothetical protein n=1 Tax=Vagococcus fluvialis TaxID=2738 RepID=UPI0032E3D05F